MMEKPETNPANKEPEKKRDRVPMTLPLRKLELPEITGYHLHWMSDRAGRIEQALRAGYEFVTPEDIGALNRTELGSGLKSTGNHDMGTRVSVISGDETLYAMKIKEEWFREDQQLLVDRNEAITDTLLRGTVGSENEDAEDRRGQKLRYGTAQIGNRSSKF